MENYYQMLVTILIALGGVGGTILTNYITNTMKLNSLIQKSIYLDEKIKVHSDFIIKHIEEDKKSQTDIQREIQTITSMIAVIENNNKQFRTQHLQLQEMVTEQNKEYTQTIKDLTKSINKLEITMEMLSKHFNKI